MGADVCCWFVVACCELLLVVYAPLYELLRDHADMATEISGIALLALPSQARNVFMVSPLQLEVQTLPHSEDESLALALVRVVVHAVDDSSNAGCWWA